MIISTRFPQHIVLPVAIPAIQVPCWPSAAGVGPWSEVCWAPGRKTDGKRPMLDGKTMETPMGNPVEKSDVNGCYIWFDDIWCRYSSFKDACSSLEDVDSCQENCEKCRALHRYHPSIHPSTFKWHCEARMNRSWDLWRALTRWTFFLKWDPYNKGCAFVVPHSGRRDYYTYHMVGKLLALWLPIYPWYP